MKLALLFLLVAAPVFAQTVIRPSSCDYRYYEDALPGSPDQTFTNWLFDIMYRDLPQGRTYRRQVSYNGRDWAFEGQPIVVPDIPGATATFTDGIALRVPPGIQIQFLRLAVEPTTNAPAMKRQMELVMAEQPETGILFAKKKRFKKTIIIEVPPHGRLIYTRK